MTCSAVAAGSDPKAIGACSRRRPDPEAVGAGSRQRPDPEAVGAGSRQRPDPEADGAGSRRRPDPEAVGAGSRQRPDPKDSGGLFASQSQSQSQSILTSEKPKKTVVEQTEDEGSDEEAIREGSQRSNSSPSVRPLRAGTNDAPTDARTDAPADAPTDARQEDGDVDEEEEQFVGEHPETANLISSATVMDEIKNCQHQINVATIALEQLRKVTLLLFFLGEKNGFFFLYFFANQIFLILVSIITGKSAGSGTRKPRENFLPVSLSS